MVAEVDDAITFHNGLDKINDISSDPTYVEDIALQIATTQ